MAKPIYTCTQGVQWFDSTAHALTTMESRQGYYKDDRGCGDNSWSGGSLADARRMMREGDKVNGDKIAARFDQGMTYAVNTEGKRWQHDFGGAFPCVPSYLGGSPMNMMNRRVRQHAKNPVRMFISIATSAGITAEQVQKRGIAVACLAQYLAVQRPVELYVYDESGCPNYTSVENDHSIVIVRLGMSPFMLNEIAFWLVNPMGQRNSMFDLQGISWPGNWPWRRKYTDPASFKRKFGEAIGGIRDEDIVLQGAYLYDAKDWNNPDAWLNEQLDKYGLLDK